MLSPYNAVPIVSHWVLTVSFYGLLRELYRVLTAPFLRLETQSHLTYGHTKPSHTLGTSQRLADPGADPSAPSPWPSPGLWPCLWPPRGHCARALCKSTQTNHHIFFMWQVCSRRAAVNKIVFWGFGMFRAPPQQTFVLCPTSIMSVPLQACKIEVIIQWENFTIPH